LNDTFIDALFIPVFEQVAGVTILVDSIVALAEIVCDELLQQRNIAVALSPPSQETSGHISHSWPVALMICVIVFPQTEHLPVF
jgi:hypothetical protein